jgi:hypothetical protein
MELEGIVSKRTDALPQWAIEGGGQGEEPGERGGAREREEEWR